MAYSTTTVTVGDYTKKIDYDRLMDNTKFLHDEVLGISDTVTQNIGATSAPIFESYVYADAIGLADANTDVNGFRAAITNVNSAGWLAYGSGHAQAGRLELTAGVNGMGSGGTDMHVLIQEASGSSVKTSIAKFDTTAWHHYGSDIRMAPSASTMNIIPGPTALTTDGGLVLGGTGSADSGIYLRAGRSFYIKNISGANRHVFQDDGDFTLTNAAGNVYLVGDSSDYILYGKDSAGTNQTILDSDAQSWTFGDSTAKAVITASGSSGLVYVYDGTANGFMGLGTGGDIYFQASTSGAQMDLALLDYLRVPQSTSASAKTFGEIRWNSGAAAGQELEIYVNTGTPGWKYINYT